MNEKKDSEISPKVEASEQGVSIGGDLKKAQVISGDQNITGDLSGNNFGNKVNVYVDNRKEITSPEFFRSHSDPHTQPFDYTICERANWGHLNAEAVLEFLKRERVTIQEDYNSSLRAKQQFSLFRFTQHEDKPAYGALLCFGESPNQFIAGCETRCFYWKGRDTKVGDILDSQTFAGNLVSQFSNSLLFLKKHLRLERQISSEGRMESFEVPLIAIQEAVANALIHREYRNRYDSVLVNLFDDRIEIVSPGSTPPPILLEALGDQQCTYPRNPLIARIFYLCGYVERAGTGVGRMVHSMLMQGLPKPEFKYDAIGNFQVTLRRPHVQSQHEKFIQLSPPPPEIVVGLDETIGLVKKSLSATASPLVIIRGWPGAGKSNAAATIAHDSDIALSYPDGVLWASLGPEPKLRQEMAVWGRALGTNDILRAPTLKEATLRLSSLLQQKRVLMIVDDVWEVEHVAPFAQARGNDCALLVTTRLPLVANGLSVPAQAVYNLPALNEEHALELLGRLAPAVLSAHPDECRQLVNAIECLPLAVHIAGRLLKAEAELGWGVVELMKELQTGKALIEAKAGANLMDLEQETIPTLATLLRKSTDRLDEHTRQCFAYLGPFAPKPATFDLAALRAMWDVDDPKPIARELCKRGLLEPVGERFQMHALLVLHAKALLAQM